jgi:hypothetical protein
MFRRHESAAGPKPPLVQAVPIWIGNFADGPPLILPIGTMGTDSSVGGMLRGSVISTQKFSIDYAAYFSAGNRNVWETGIVYRFLFPTWKGK